MILHKNSQQFILKTTLHSDTLSKTSKWRCSMEETRLIFGAAYYTEYMPCERLDEDMKMMRAAGFTTIRIGESTWSTVEPRPGEYDFSYIDRVIDAAEKSGILVIVGTPTYAVPSWLVNLDADVLATTSKGKNRYGTRQNMDITNSTFRKYAEGVIRAMVSHTAPRKNVIGFQIDNETKYYDTAGPVVQKLFRENLIERFKTPEAMNDAFVLHYWSNAIHDWEEFPDVTGTINAGLGCAFDRFRRQLAADFLHWQADIVREYLRPDQFITQNFDFDWQSFGPQNTQDGYSWGVQPGINHFDAVNAVTLVGTDIYHHTQDKLDGMTIAFGGDEMWALKKQNYLVCECQAQAFKSWLPYPGQLRLQAYSHIASGAMGLMYWNWHSIHNGYETYWRGLLSHDFGTNPTYEEACRIGKELRENAGSLAGISKHSRTALLVSNEALSALQWFPTDENLSYNDIVLWMYEALYRQNIACDVIFTEEADWSRYDMLVIPALYTASEELITRIRRFTEAGGTVFASFRSFVANGDATVYHDAQPHGLTDCFGMTYNQFTQPEEVFIEGVEACYWMELLKPKTAKTVFHYTHRHWGKYAACTKNHYGKGTAWYLGCWIPGEQLEKLLAQAADEAGILVPPEHFPVILREGINQYGEKLHFLLHYQDMPGKTVSRWKAEELLTGKQYYPGDTIPLEAWGVCILKENE